MGKFNEESGKEIAPQFFPNSELYEAFFENSREIFLVVEGSTIVDCNRSAFTFLGVGSKNELIGKLLAELSAESDGAKKITEFSLLTEKGKDQKFSWQLRKSDKTVVNVDISVRKIHSDNREYRLISLQPENNILPGSKNSDDKYKRIFDSVQDLYYRTDLDGTILEVSPSVKKYAGFVDDDLVGKSSKEYYYNQDDRQLLLEELQKTGEVFDYELLLRGKNGKKIWTSISAHLLYDENSRVTGLEGWIRGISERKLHEEKLKQSLSLLRATLNSTTDGILVVDLQGKILSYNETFKRLFNLSDSLLNTRDDNLALLAAMKSLKDPDQFLLKVRELYNHPEEESYDTLDFNDGRIIERYSRPQWIDGQPVGRVWSFRDESERKKAEQQLNLMAHTLKSINECVSITDTTDNILFVNEAFSKTYGYSPEELVGKNISVVRPELNDDQMVSQILDLTSEEGWKGEINNRRKDGSIFPISLSTTIVKDDNGNKLGLVGVASDITERKAAERELREKEERYRSLFEGSPDAIFLADIETGIIVGANSASARLLKKSIDQIIGMHQSELHPNDMVSESRQMFSNHVDILNRRETFKTSESSVQCSDGTIIPVEIMASVVHINGKPAIQGVFRNIAERKAAEKAILESEKRYRLLIENQGEGVTIVDSEENFVFVNPAAERIFEVKPGTLTGKNISEFVTPEYFERIRRETEKRKKNKKSTYELEIVSAKGNLKTLLVTGTPQTDDAGKLTGTFGVILDITGRKKSEAELQAKEALLNTLVQTIPDLIWVKDVDGVYLTCNKMFESFMGASASEIIGKTDYDFVPRELADFFRENDKKAIELGGPSRNDEWITYANDGHKALVETIKTPMYDNNGTLIGVLGIGRDVTDRKMAEDQLRQSEEKYRKLIESMPDGVYRSTHEGKFIEVNPAMVKMLGYDNIDDLLSIDIKKQLYFDPNDRESLALQLNDKELDVFPLKKKDGTAVYVEDHGWYVKDSAGNIVFHEGIMRDVTERKKDEIQLKKYSQELQELNGTKDKFFSIIAHDLKSPFSSITGLSEILKNEARHIDISTIEQYATIINYTSNNTFQLLENLLEWALVQQSQIVFRPSPIVVNQVVANILELYSEKAVSKQITTSNLIPENLVVRADENMIKTVFRNLISNALKFTPTRGTIRISADLIADQVKFSVKDSGIGISKENLERLFSVGSTYSQRGTENEKGTGIGLILCKEFVERHGGKIWVESEPGSGSEFIFTLPLKA